MYMCFFLQICGCVDDVMIYAKWNEDLAFVFGFPFYCEFIHSVAIGVIIFVSDYCHLPSYFLEFDIVHLVHMCFVIFLAI